MTYKFQLMKELLQLLDKCNHNEEQQQILVDVYKMHLNVLEWVEFTSERSLLDILILSLSFSGVNLFRSYYFIYGLVQLGNNLLCNCSILYILQTIGFDIGSFAVLIISSTQVFIACAFGQQLQVQVNWTYSLKEMENMKSVNSLKF